MADKVVLIFQVSLSHLNPCSLFHDAGLKDCMQSRPPINPELSGPSIFSYDPPKDRPEMTNFPAFTFRPKTQSDRGEWWNQSFLVSLNPCILKFSYTQIHYMNFSLKDLKQSFSLSMRLNALPLFFLLSSINDKTSLLLLKFIGWNKINCYPISDTLLYFKIL